MISRVGHYTPTLIRTLRRWGDVHQPSTPPATAIWKASTPYVWLDGKCVKVRFSGRVENQVAIVAFGANQSGQREILGFDVGPPESHDFWLAFLRSLAKRGLRGTRLVISDAHEGLKQAIAEVLTGAR